MGREIHVLNLGGGKQSTRLYLGFLDGEFQPALDYAVFADTGEERHQTYEHISWLQSLGGPPILVCRHPDTTLGDSLMKGMNGHGGRFVTIPAFTTIREGDYRHKGIARRQCTKEFKTLMIGRCIRKEILGLEPGQQIPAGVTVHQYFGISWDERVRAFDIERRYKKPSGLPIRGYRCHFPLIEPPNQISRADCDRFLEARVPHRVVKSACVFCPFHSDQEWQEIRDEPESWARVVQIDTALRTVGVAFNRKMDQPLYLHETCLPIERVDFANETQGKLGFMMECTGMCGV